MPTPPAAWIDSLLPLFAKILSEERADLIRRGWSQYADRPEPLVALPGPYNGGKTSLLKRLLIDDGQPVPGWVTISAKPETTACHEVAALDCIFRDTPGLCSGNEAHDTKAEYALLGADALMVVLLPQLLTGDWDAVIRILSGRLFHPQGLPYPAGAVFCVVSRMDTGSISPREAEDEYRQFIENKRQELKAQLEKAGLGFVNTHLVAPDAGGRVGNRSDARRESYDRSRGWDGMAELEAALSALPAERARLREATGVRYFLYVGHKVLAQARKSQAAYRALAEDTQAALEQCQGWRAELDLMMEAAQADLSNLLEHELLAAARECGTDIAQLRQFLETKLEAALGRWSKRYTEQLSEFTEQVEVQWAARSSRVSSARLTEALDPPGEPSSAEKSSWAFLTAPDLPDKLTKFQKHAKNVVEYAMESDLGMSIGETRAKLRMAPKLLALKRKAARAGSLLSAQKRELARDYIRTYDFVVKLVPAAIEASRLILPTLNEGKEARERSANQREVDEHLRTQAQKIADLYWKGDPERKMEGWLSIAEELHAILEDTRLGHHQTLVAAQQELSELSTQERELQGLLDAHP